jgi:hypothetical protein
MGLKDARSSYTYVNIKQGQLVVKVDNEVKTYRSLEGIIKKVEFVMEEYEGRKIEKAKFLIDDVGDLYVLQMRTDSGYFRGFVNSLRSSSNPKGLLEVIPNIKKQEGKNPQTTCFVFQDGSALKHYFTKEFNGDYPELEKKEIKGQIVYDNYNQIQYWKKWLNEIFNTNTSEISAPPEVSEDIVDDLPF